MKKPTVALVEAASSSAHIFSMARLPRVGVPTMGEVLKGMGYECELWFQAMPGFDEERLKDFDIVGIGSLTNTIPEAYRLADSLKGSETTVVMGGPHATFMPEEAIHHCDYVVMGEGDATFPALVESIAKDKIPEDIPGLVYTLPDGDIHCTGSADVVDYENLPSPNFMLSPQVQATRIPPMLATSRGCPHNCTFCSVTTVFGRRYRFKRNKQVIEELRPILDRSVCFGDDNFCSSPARTKSLLKDMIDQDAVPLRWAGQMCVGAGSDEELLGLMQETRCRIMYVGIESIDRETLKKFGKAHDVEAIDRCVENLHKHNIGIHGMFVMGMDDDAETVRKIVDYAIAMDIDTIQICSMTPFPGTAIYKEFQDKMLHQEWKYFDGMHVVVDRPNCSAYDAQMAIVRGLKRFYGLTRGLGSYRRGRGWRLKYRIGGHFLLGRWVRENADYFERLRTDFSI